MKGKWFFCTCSSEALKMFKNNKSEGKKENIKKRRRNPILFFFFLDLDKAGAEK